MGPENVMMGDMTQATALPQAPAEKQEEAIAELRKKAKYSRSKEFGELRAMMEQRIEFYQKYLPDGRSIATQENLSKYWRVATLVIAELQQVIDMYQNAEEELKAIEAKLT